MIEEWRGINGVETLYEVSTFGNVRSLPHEVIQPAKNGSFSKHIYPGKQLKPTKHRDGYLFVNICGKLRPIHRLVAETFLEATDGKNVVNHIDGDKTNNVVSNLEWCTPSENMKHAARTGLLHFSSDSCKEARKVSISKAIERNKKKIVQYDKHGEKIAEYPSVIEASRVTGSNATHISLCAKGKHHTCNGYIWRYAV